MTASSRRIEIDLLETIGDHVPERVTPSEEVLWQPMLAPARAITLE